VSDGSRFDTSSAEIQDLASSTSELGEEEDHGMPFGSTDLVHACVWLHLPVIRMTLVVAQ